MLSAIKKGLIHLFYPTLCEGCKKPLVQGEEVLCIDCGSQIPRTDYHEIPDNDTSMRFAGRIPFHYATSLAWFTPDGLLQHLMHGLKYKRKKEIGTYLGHILGNELGQTNWIKKVDMIIPVPLHPKKQAARGYNQSSIIAHAMGKALHIPVDEKILVRKKHTESQTKKTREERVKNMAGAFELDLQLPMKNKHVLLVDDVLTTGATMEACGQILVGIEGVKLSFATIGIAV